MTPKRGKREDRELAEAGGVSGIIADCAGPVAVAEILLRAGKTVADSNALWQRSMVR